MPIEQGSQPKLYFNRGKNENIKIEFTSHQLKKFKTYVLIAKLKLILSKLKINLFNVEIKAEIKLNIKSVHFLVGIVLYI
jgi:hypothetical protein